MAEKEIGKLYTTIEVRGTKQVENDLKKLEQEANKEAKKIQDDFKKYKINLDTKLGQMSIKDLTKEYKIFEKALQKDIKLGLPQSEIAETKTRLDQLKQKLSDAGVEAQKTGFSFKNMVAGFLAGAAIYKGVQALKDFAIEAVKSASKLEGIKAGFDKLNNPNLLANLKKATRGTVTDLELMQRSVMANNFKIPLDQLSTYFQFATNRAIETGQSVDYLVESIITGIGRKSVLVMDNLGISAVELQQEVSKVGDFGKAAGNIIAREMAKAGEVQSTLATQIARAGTAWDNFTTAVGQAIVTFGGNLSQKLGFADLADLINDQTRRVKEFFGVIEKGYAGFKASSLEGSIGLDAKGRTDALKAEYARMNDLVKKISETKPKVPSVSLIFEGEATQKARADLVNYEAQLKLVKATIAGINQINADYANGIRDVNGNLINQANKMATLGTLRKEEATKLKELQAIQAKGSGAGLAELEAATVAYEEVKAKLDALLPEKEKELKLNNDLEQQLSKLTEKYNSLTNFKSKEATELAKSIALKNQEVEAMKKANEQLALTAKLQLEFEQGKFKSPKAKGLDSQEFLSVSGVSFDPKAQDAQAKIKPRLGQELEKIKMPVQDLNTEFDFTDSLLDNLKTGAADFTNALNSGLTQAIMKGDSLADTLKNIGNMFLSMLINAGLSAATGGISNAISSIFSKTPSVATSMPTIPSIGAVGGNFSPSQSSGSNAKIEGLLNQLIINTANNNIILAKKDMSITVKAERGMNFSKEVAKDQANLVRAGFKP